MHYFHLMRTLKQKNLYFFALKMANNTLILQIVVDFVSKVPIFKLFSRFWRGSFCLKMFPSSKKSQVPFSGGHSISKSSQVQKSPKSGRGRGGHRHLGTFPKCWRFLILKASLILFFRRNHMNMQYHVKCIMYYLIYVTM